MTTHFWPQYRCPHRRSADINVEMRRFHPAAPGASLETPTLLNGYNIQNPGNIHGKKIERAKDLVTTVSVPRTLD